MTGHSSPSSPSICRLLKAVAPVVASLRETVTNECMNPGSLSLIDAWRQFRGLIIDDESGAVALDAVNAITPQLATVVAYWLERPQCVGDDASRLIDNDVWRVCEASDSIRAWVQSISPQALRNNAHVDAATEPPTARFWHSLCTLMGGKSILLLKRRAQASRLQRRVDGAASPPSCTDGSPTDTGDFVGDAAQLTSELQSILHRSLIAFCGEFETMRQAVDLPSFLAPSEPTLAHRRWYVEAICVDRCQVLHSRERTPFALVCVVVDRALPFRGSAIGNMFRGPFDSNSLFCFSPKGKQSTSTAGVSTADESPILRREVVALVKTDDDLRQEVLAMQLISVINGLLSTAVSPLPSLAELRAMAKASVASPGTRKKSKARQQQPLFKSLFGASKKEDAEAEADASSPRCDREAEPHPLNPAAASFAPDVRIPTYGIQVVSACGSGLVQPVPGSASVHRLMSTVTSPTGVAEEEKAKVLLPSQLHSAHERASSASPQRSSLSNGFRRFIDGLKEGNEHAALSQLWCTSVAAAAMSYILNVKDRHNANILITDSGALVHIDFGFFLSAAPGGMVALERCGFKLHDEILAAVLGGSVGGPGFAKFRADVVGAITHVCRAAAAQTQNPLRCALEALHPAFVRSFRCFSGLGSKRGGDRGVVDAAASELEARLFLGDLSRDPLDPEAAAEAVRALESMVNDCAKNGGTRRYDRFQKASNGILYQ